MGYGQLILSERRKWHITQTELAKYIGIYPATLVDIEREKLEINSTTLDEFLKAIMELSKSSKA